MFDQIPAHCSLAKLAHNTCCPIVEATIISPLNYYCVSVFVFPSFLVSALTLPASPSPPTVFSGAAPLLKDLVMGRMMVPQRCPRPNPQNL